LPILLLLHDDIYEALSDFERQFGNVHVLVGGKLVSK